MKQHLDFVQRFVLFVTPLVANCVVAIAPSQAATFARSEGGFYFTNFSQNPSGVKTITDTNTIAIANKGTLDAVANAQANFLTRSPEAFNSSLSEVVGEGRDYLGEAESEATVLGYFVVDANKSFSFDFTTDLNLQTSIDNSQVENASADGDISFALVDTDNKSILDFFNLIGNITTPGEDDFIAYQKSDNVTVLKNPEPKSNFGGSQESATAQVQGSVQRSFANKTNLALVEVERNRARVANPDVPEAMTVLSSLTTGAFLMALKIRKSKIRKI